MSKSKYNHTHQYEAINEAKKVYRCTVDDCPHSINASMLVGRKCTCPNCGESISITKEHLLRKIITCIGCGVLKGNVPPIAARTYPVETQAVENTSLQSLLEKIKGI